jgi:MFS family permease
MSSHPPLSADQSVKPSVVTPFFLSSLAWNVALGMTYILVPLYARSLGMSGVQIGTLISLPVIVQIGFTLIGGALADRIGGKNMAMAACIMTGISGVAFMASSGFASMLAAQFIMVIARAIFWPATWSLASQLPGHSGKQMGRLNAFTNAGQIAGTAAAGFIIGHAGFGFGFGAMAAAGFAALALNQMYRIPGAAPRAQGESVFNTYRVLFRMRAIRYAILCAYIAALPVALSFSFYPILLVDQGFASDVTGTLMSLRAVGGIVAGFIAGHFITHTRGITTPLISAIVVGLSAALGAAMAQPVLISAFLFALGAGSAVMTLYFQLLVSQVSSKETRGSAMALGNIGWGISLLATPFAMGILKDLVGIKAAFYIMGGFAILCGLALVPLQRWARVAEPAKAP